MKICVWVYDYDGSIFVKEVLLFVEVMPMCV